MPSLLNALSAKNTKAGLLLWTLWQEKMASAESSTTPALSQALFGMSNDVSAADHQGKILFKSVFKQVSRQVALQKASAKDGGLIGVAQNTAVMLCPRTDSLPDCCRQ